MANQYILGIDQGTTGSTAILLDENGSLIGHVNQEFTQHFPKESWVEHNPLEILESIKKATNLLCIQKNINKKQIKCIGITNQRETTVAWDKNTKKPICNAIVWQCKRTMEACRKLNKKVDKNWIYEKTGLLIDPYFSATKIKWILDQYKPDLNNLAVGTVDSWLIFNLTNGKQHVTEPSNASRTLLCNIKNAEWDAELEKTFEVPISILPTILSSNATFGYTEGLNWLPDGIPITGVLGDQQASLFGHGQSINNWPKCTFGTGSFILSPSEFDQNNINKGLITTIAWKLNDKIQHATEGASFIAGAAVQWLRDNLKIINSSSEIEQIAMQCSNSKDVCFIPALSGLGSPYWRPDVKGIISGLTRDSGLPEIARATLEGIALINYDIINKMDQAKGAKTTTLLVDGGATKNKLLMQIQSDLLQCKIKVPKITETTSFGAALIAGLGAGIWTSIDQLELLNPTIETFEPQETNNEFLLNKWRQNIDMLTR